MGQIEEISYLHQFQNIKYIFEIFFQHEISFYIFLLLYDISTTLSPIINNPNPSIVSVFALEALEEPVPD